MALFNKPNQQTDNTANTTIISAGTRINGTVKSQLALHVDGHLEGTIESKGTVNIGSRGRLKGDINAKKLLIMGHFQGNADCDAVEILAGGNVRGKIVSKNLSIDHECTFEGESVRKK